MLVTLLAVSRLAHYVATTGLFGLCLFAVLAWPIGPRLLRGFSIAALVSGLAWFAANTMTMTGDAAAVLDPSMLAVVAGTGFGVVWIARLVLAAALCFMISPRLKFASLTLAGLLLASISLTGHARSHEGLIGDLHIASDSIHLLGAGAWLGGLAALSVLLRGADGSDEALALKARRVAAFSIVGYFAVGGLVASGVINGALIVASPAALVSTLYGRLLLLKVALFGGMLCLALYNRFRISPALEDPRTAAAGFHHLRRNVILEQSLGTAILMVVSVLGTLDPSS